MSAPTPPAEAQVVGLRRMVEKLAAHVRPTCCELWEEAQAALSAQPRPEGDLYDTILAAVIKSAPRQPENDMPDAHLLAFRELESIAGAVFAAVFPTTQPASAPVGVDARREIERAIERARVFDDGGDGADAESAQSVVAILEGVLAQQPAAVDGAIQELFETASKGFHISETCGPDAKYWHISKFRTMTDLHTYSDAWRAVMRLAKPQGEG